MNKERRSELDKAAGIIESVMQDEQESLDNLPESLQSGERGEAMQSAIDAMQEALDVLETAAQ